MAGCDRREAARGDEIVKTLSGRSVKKPRRYVLVAQLPAVVRPDGSTAIPARVLGYHVGTRTGAFCAAAKAASKAMPEAIPWRKAGRRTRVEATHRGVIV